VGVLEELDEGFDGGDGHGEVGVGGEEVVVGLDYAGGGLVGVYKGGYEGGG
jgi:hypothetical protein